MTAVKPVEATAVESRADRRPSISAGVRAALAVLDLVAARSPLSLSEISHDLGIAKSTLHRICVVLVERDRGLTELPRWLQSFSSRHP